MKAPEALAKNRRNTERAAAATRKPRPKEGRAAPAKRGAGSVPAPALRANGAPSDNIGYQVHETFLNMSRALRTRVARLKVTSSQWYFLRALWVEEGVTQRQLSERVGTTEATTVSAIKLLLRNGWIVKAPHPADRRAATIYLTSKGKKLRERLMPYAHEVNAIALQGFSGAEARALNDMLVRIRTNIIAHDRNIASVSSGLVKQR